MWLYHWIEKVRLFPHFSLSVRFMFLLSSESLLFCFSLVQELLHFLHCSPMQYSHFSPQDYISITQAHTLLTTWHANRHKPSSFSPTNPRKCMQVLKVISFITIIMYVWSISNLFFFQNINSQNAFPRSPPSSSTCISFFKINFNI